MDECRQQKHTQHAPSMNMEYDYLYVWVKSWSHKQTSLQQLVDPRDLAGNAKEEGKEDEEEEDLQLLFWWGSKYSCLSRSIA